MRTCGAPRVSGTLSLPLSSPYPPSRAALDDQTASPPGPAQRDAGPAPGCTGGSSLSSAEAASRREPSAEQRRATLSAPFRTRHSHRPPRLPASRPHRRRRTHHFVRLFPCERKSVPLKHNPFQSVTGKRCNRQ